MTKEQLSKIYTKAKPNAIELFLPHLVATMEKFEIDTPLRQAHFLAQIGHESGELRYVHEIWGPTEAQKRYEGRKDLGNTIPGDGKRFMGRGLIQITGRNNYKEISKKIFNDARLLENPDLLAAPEYAVMSAGLFWSSRNLNRWADQDNLKEVTLRINGGSNGLADRERLLKNAKSVLI